MFLYDISAFMLHFKFYFSYEVGRFLCPFFIMTSQSYYDVTLFLTDLNENCTAYVKLKIKNILFMRIF